MRRTYCVLFFFIVNGNGQHRGGPTRSSVVEQPVAKVSVGFIGKPGNLAYCYWVITRYPTGNAYLAGPRCITNIPTILSRVDSVRIAWPKAPGASAYDVIRSSTPTFPTPAECASCAVTLATNSLTVSDQGSHLLPYPLTAWPTSLARQSDIPPDSRFAGTRSDAARKPAIVSSSSGYNVLSYGATRGCGASEDNSTAFNAAIMAAFSAGGGVILVPPGCYRVTSPIIMKSNVRLTGDSWSFLDTPAPTVLIRSVGAITAITTTAPTVNVYVSGLSLQGPSQPGAPVPNSSGIDMTDAASPIFSNLYIAHYGKYALHLGGGRVNGAMLDTVWTADTMNAFTATEYIGSIDIAPTDPVLRNLGINGNVLYGSHGAARSCYIAAAVIRSPHAFISDSVFDLAQTGLVLLGGLGRITNSRAAFNQCDGLLIPSTASGGNLVSTFSSYANGQDTSGAYSGFHLSRGANKVTGAWTGGNDVVDGFRTKYGIYDDAPMSDQPNYYEANSTDGLVTTGDFGTAGAALSGYSGWDSATYQIRCAKTPDGGCLYVKGSIIADADNASSLGSPSRRWSGAYFGSLGVTITASLDARAPLDVLNLSPTQQAARVTGGIQLTPMSTDKGCTTGTDIGKIWFDSTTATTIVKVCVNFAGTVTWSAIVTEHLSLKLP